LKETYDILYFRWLRLPVHVGRAGRWSLLRGLCKPTLLTSATDLDEHLSNMCIHYYAALLIAQHCLFCKSHAAYRSQRHEMKRVDIHHLLVHLALRARTSISSFDLRNSCKTNTRTWCKVCFSITITLEDRKMNIYYRGI
jgi:hypothetical protein